MCIVRNLQCEKAVLVSHEDGGHGAFMLQFLPGVKRSAPAKEEGAESSKRPRLSEIHHYVLACLYMWKHVGGLLTIMWLETKFQDLVRVSKL